MAFSIIEPERIGPKQEFVAILVERTSSSSTADVQAQLAQSSSRWRLGSAWSKAMKDSSTLYMEKGF